MAGGCDQEGGNQEGLVIADLVLVVVLVLVVIFLVLLFVLVLVLLLVLVVILVLLPPSQKNTVFPQKMLFFH